jgi:hypothetical protein
VVLDGDGLRQVRHHGREPFLDAGELRHEAGAVEREGDPLAERLAEPEIARSVAAA